MKHISLLFLASWIGLTACSNTSSSVYQQLGGAPGVNQIVENFVIEIENNPTILAYFKGANIDRFVDKLSEQICHRTGGPCEYTGDSMAQVHAGMNINQRDFNLTVDLLINAMTKANIPHRLQNQVLKVLAPTRDEMLYL